MKIALHGHYGYLRLIRSSVPGIAMMLVGSIYSVVDGLFVSNFVGTTAFAALNVIWPAIMLKLCLPNHPPLLADNGEGCTADKTLCFGFFTLNISNSS